MAWERGWRAKGRREKGEAGCSHDLTPLGLQNEGLWALGLADDGL